MTFIISPKAIKQAVNHSIRGSCESKFAKKSFNDEDSTEVDFLQQTLMKSRALNALPIPLTS